MTPEPRSSNVWDPEQYERFKRERAQPFLDLLARIPDGPVRYAADLGCGTGELTRLLLAKWPGARVWGVDSSAEMLRRACDGEPDDRLTFVEADLGRWRAPQPLDRIVSNAALQWLPNHAALLAQLAAQLAPGGVLAVQVPNNGTEAAYRVLADLTAQPRWAARLRRSGARPAVELPESYIMHLRGLGLAAEVWETSYYHQLPDPLAIVEWLKGTSLRPVLSALAPEEASEFLSSLRSGIAKVYEAGPFGVVFPFRRLFLVGCCA